MGTLRLSSITTDENLHIIYSNPYSNKLNRKTPIINPLIEYFSAYKSNKFLGCFMIINSNKHEIEIHSMLLKEAIPYSRDLGKMILSKCFENENIMRITAPIKENFNTVKNYVKNLGFKLEGIKRNATIENNKILNVEHYGLLREEL